MKIDIAGITSACLPASMTQFKVNYRYRETMFRITVIELAEGEGNPGITVDGVEQSGTTLRLVDDRIEHVAEVRMRRG